MFRKHGLYQDFKTSDYTLLPGLADAIRGWDTAFRVFVSGLDEKRGWSLLLNTT
jgi:hypothetical protein